MIPQLRTRDLAGSIRFHTEKVYLGEHPGTDGAGADLGRDAGA